MPGQRGYIYMPFTWSEPTINVDNEDNVSISPNYTAIPISLNAWHIDNLDIKVNDVDQIACVQGVCVVGEDNDDDS
jgi:hypothetical protein